MILSIFWRLKLYLDEGRRLLNQKDTDPEVQEIVEEYVDMQEQAVEKLKQFL